VRFYGYFRSSAAHRCRIALALKGLAPELAFVHLRRGDQKVDTFRAVNPQGLVPALEVSERVVTQSLAIIEYLDEEYPEPAFLPDTSLDRAEVRAFAQIIACDIHPLQNLRVLRWLKNEYDQEQADLDRWCRHWIEEGLTACEAILSRRGDAGPFCFGAAPGLADICLVPQLFSARRFGLDLSAFPLLLRAEAAASQLPAFADAAPARQPDSEEP
jgi:maleylacetoacetate isomerase